MFGRPPALKTYVEKRTASVAAQVARTSKGHVPTGGFGFGGPPKLGVLMAPPMIAAMDKDRDEKLSRDEWLGGIKRLCDSCTKDKDGHADMKSLKAGLNALIPQEGAPPGPFQLGDLMAGPIFGRADANRDGKLTFEELLAAAGVVFDEFDKEKTGKLDEDAFAGMLTAVFPAPKFGPPPGRPPEKGK